MMIMVTTMMMMKMTKIRSIVLLSLLALTATGSMEGNQLDLELQQGNLLTRLSLAGEECVLGEIKRALLSVKQLVETLDAQQHTHLQLMDTLALNFNKKRGAEQLAVEAEQKLKEVERLCHDNLKSKWVECRPCLEESCRTYYTSTCRRNANTVFLQVGDFFRRMTRDLDSQERLYNQQSEETTQSPDNSESTSQMPAAPEPLPPQPQSGATMDPDSFAKAHGGGLAFEEEAELRHLNESLNEAQKEAEALFAGCQETVARMHSLLGTGFHAAFNDELRPKPLAPTGLAGFTQSILELGRSAMQEVEVVVQEVRSALQEVESTVEGVSSALTGLFHGMTSNIEDTEPKTGGSMCRQLLRQPANCRRLREQCVSCRDTFLTECPAVSQQYSELQEISVLVNASCQQYVEVKSVTLRHLEHTLLWARHMIAKHAWVTHVTRGTTTPKHTFSISKLTLGGSEALDGKGAWLVEMQLLDYPPISLSVPAQLEPSDPAFINYISQKALEDFKSSIPLATS